MNKVSKQKQKNDYKNFLDHVVDTLIKLKQLKISDNLINSISSLVKNKLLVLMG